MCRIETARRIKRVIRYVCICAVTALYSAVLPVFANNGAPYFYQIQGGTLLMPLGNGTDEARSIIQQPDGKILVAGSSNNDSNYDYSVLRLHPDGSLDQSFADNGKLVLAVGDGYDASYAMALQVDGKIVLAGKSFNGSNYDYSVVRLHNNGSLDEGFASGGKLVLSVGNNDDYANSMAIQADGKILIAGYSLEGVDRNYSAVRLKPDGSLDETFANSGKLMLSLTHGNDYAYSLLLQTDGKIILAGQSSTNNSYGYSAVRLHSDGALDESFAAGGILLLPADGEIDSAYGIIQQPNGQILLAGSRRVNNNQSDFTAVRLNGEGALDESFGVAGRLVIPLDHVNDRAGSVVQQTDGKILQAGYSGSGYDANFTVVRWHSDGTLDESFAEGGRLVLPVGPSNDFSYSMQLQTDGKILLAGQSWDGNQNVYSVVRLNNDGSLDNNFNRTNKHGLFHTALYTEQGSAIVLNPLAQVFDSELATIGNYAGSSLILARSGGPNTEDIFTTSGHLRFVGGDALWQDTVIAEVLQYAGSFMLKFNSAANQEIVDGVLQSLSYQNSSNTPPASVPISWMFVNGNMNEQYGGDELIAEGQTEVHITAVNDAPVAVQNFDSQTALANKPFEFQFSTDAFIDVDGDILSYSANLADGSALPSWLQFDAVLRTFSGTPSSFDIGDIVIRLMASDSKATASVDIVLSVKADVLALREFNLLGSVQQAHYGSALALLRLDNSLYADVLIGAPGNSGTVNGKPAKNTGALDWYSFAEKAVVNSFAGDKKQLRFATAIAAVADQNDDGIKDLVIGKSHAGKLGEVALQSGATGELIRVLLSAEKALPVVHSQVELKGRFGEVLAVADVDRDGIDDLIIGMPNSVSKTPAKLAKAGAVVVFNGLSDEVKYVRFGSTKAELFGAALSVDTQASQLLVGSPQYSPMFNGKKIAKAGRVQLFAANEGNSSAIGEVVGSVKNQLLGDAVASFAQDINGDGLNDWAVAQPGHKTAAQVQIYSGLNTQPFALQPVVAPFKRNAIRLASGADINADGVNDLAIGLPLNTVEQIQANGKPKKLKQAGGLLLVSGTMFTE